MDHFNQRKNAIDKNAIRLFLQNKETPCYESELYRIAFPESRIFDENSLTLYQNHFLLFHLLYLLQSEYFKMNRYLHIHFMRIFLTDYPPDGYCRHYEEELNQFCRSICEKEGSYCDFHLEMFGETELEELSSRYFYLDAENYYRLDEKSAQAFMEGTWEMLNHYKDLEKSYRILDLPESADRQTVKRKFRKLAKKYHPDKGSSSHEKFNEINRAYRFILKKIFN